MLLPPRQAIPAIPTPPAAPALPVPTVAPQATPPAMAGPTPSVDALMARRNELSTQLASVVSRRSGVARDIARADPQARDGLVQRLAVLDKRIIQLEGEIQDNSEALANARMSETRYASPDRPFQFSQKQSFVLTLVVVMLVFVPVAMAVSRLLYRRPARQAPPAGWDEQNRRLERIEQAIDAIAIEIERVTEGQRFMTKVMAERGAASAGAAADSAGNAPASSGTPGVRALGPGEPDLLEIPVGEKVGVRRG